MAKNKNRCYKNYELKKCRYVNDYELIDKKTGMTYGYPLLVGIKTPEEVLEDFLRIYKLA